MHSLSPRAKRILLVATLAPVVVIVLSIAGIVGFAFAATNELEAISTVTEKDDIGGPRAGVIAIMALGQLGFFLIPVAALWIFGLMLAYAIDAGRSPLLTQGQQVGWILAIVVGNVAGMIAYWIAVVRGMGSVRRVAA
jgi:hypothetical protein